MAGNQDHHHCFRIRVSTVVKRHLTMVSYNPYKGNSDKGKPFIGMAYNVRGLVHHHRGETLRHASRYSAREKAASSAY